MLKNIQIGRDFGTRVEVVSGLDAADRVIDSPPDWLAQGDVVRTMPSAAAPVPAKSPEGKIVARADAGAP